MEPQNKLFHRFTPFIISIRLKLSQREDCRWILTGRVQRSQKREADLERTDLISNRNGSAGMLDNFEWERKCLRLQDELPITSNYR